MAGGVVAAISTSQGIGLAGVDWWAYGGLYGTASGAALGFILRLAGAPMPWMGRHAVGPRTDVPPSLPPSASGMQPRGAWGNRVPQRVGPGLQAAGVVLFLVGMTTGSWEPLLKRTAPTAHGLLNDATGGGGLGLLGWTLVIAGFVVILAGKVLAGIRGDPDR
jgi:hypothetical protein